MAENKALPSITQLAKDSWELFKKTWVSYLKLVGLTIAYVFLGLLIGLLISLPITFLAIGSGFNLFGHLTPFQIGTFVLLFLWVILFVVSMIAIDVIFPIASIFILQGKKISPIFDLIKATLPYFWPFFLTVLLSGLLATGGMIFLVLPGFLIAFFFAFVTYEVVVDGKSGRTAMARSYFMVKNNFWEVLIRLFVLELAFIIISSTLGRIGQNDGLVRLVHFIFLIFASWYMKVYGFLLYKEVRAKTTFPAQIPMQWIWIVSIIGWVVIVLALVGVGFGLSHLPTQPHHINKTYPAA